MAKRRRRRKPAQPETIPPAQVHAPPSFEADAIVIDNGSGLISAGFAGSDNPRAQFPSIVGKESLLSKACYVGNEAQAKRDVLHISYPIQDGIVTNWDDMEQIWYHTFNDELRVAPEEHFCLMSESVVNPKPNREIVVEILLEKFQVPSCFLASQSTLALYSSGRETGLILESGYTTTRAVPIYTGSPLKYAIQQLNLGGKHLTEYLTTLLNNRGYEFNAGNVNDIKQSLCYVPIDFEREKTLAATTSSLETTYKLPDNQVVTLNSERFQCTQPLFDPSLVHNEGCGIDLLLYNAASKCCGEIRQSLYENLVLAGGNTMFDGISGRLHKGLEARASNMKIKIVAPSERKLSVWIGGTIVGSLSSFQPYWLGLGEYLEYGPASVSRKFTI